jgi:hypothetical protein
MANSVQTIGHKLGRSETRKYSTHPDDPEIKVSLCPCNDPFVNLERLNSFEYEWTRKERSTRPEYKLQRLLGLRDVLNHLLMPRGNFPDYLEADKETRFAVIGFLTFKDAFQLYSSQILFEQVDESRFTLDILDEQIGLSVNIVKIVNVRYIVLKNIVDLPGLLIHSKQLQEQSKDNQQERFHLGKNTLKQITRTMDTEYDRNIAKWIFSVNMSHSQMRKAGVDPQKVVRQTDKNLKIIEECESAVVEAQTKVEQKLKEKTKCIQEKVEERQNQVNKRKRTWDQTVLDELEDEIEDLQNHKAKLEDELKSPDSTSFKLKVIREAKNINEKKRIKRRKLGQGRPNAIDEDEETFVARCIESKATYHGRRKETTMFINRRVKCKNLLKILNKRRADKGKAPLRSTTAIWNRSKPRRLGTIQASRHVGKGLWSCKKPPKAEDLDNENTHHQRSHIKNMKRFLFSSKVPENAQKFAIIESRDDHAFLRPGTSVGFEGSRTQKILTPVAKENARVLPKYDFPESKMYCAPGAHRMFTMKSVTVDEKEKLVIDSDEHYVFCRPKHYVDSSGTTWANEEMELRHTTDIYHATDSRYSSEFTTLCKRLRDDCFYYLDTNVAEDFKRSGDNEEYTIYEEKRVAHLKRRVELALEQYENLPEKREMEMKTLSDILRVRDVVKECVTLHTNLAKSKTVSYHSVQGDHKRLVKSLQKVVTQIEELELPVMKSRQCIRADSGPGVGCGNHEVQFRMAEVARISNADMRIILHGSRGDSGQNEAEQTNSGVSNAVCDGSTIEWEKHKRFENLTSEEIAGLTLEDYNICEELRDKKNAWCVAREVALRVDGAPCMGEYMKGFVAIRPSDAFFWNKEYLERFYKTQSADTKEKIPGYYYMQKIIEFDCDHTESGELYREYVKHGCLEKKNQLCDWCKEHNFVGPSCGRIPRPFPNYNKDDFHYLDVFDTPMKIDGKPRSPDDMQPRANIKKLVKDKKLILGDNSIEVFSKKFIIPETQVIEAVKHIQENAVAANLRNEERKKRTKEKRGKKFADYDWKALIEEGKLSDLHVYELDKYLKAYKLPLNKRTKKDKIKMIISHFNKNVYCEGVVVADEVPSSENDSDSENELLDLNETWPSDSDFNNTDSTDADEAEQA